MEKGQLKRKSRPSGPDEEVETKAIQNWLRMVDKPLTKEKQDRKDAGPRNE